MKPKLIIVLLMAVLLSEHINSQNDYLNHQKYWFYRWRLLKSFMVVGDCDGCSIPANQRHYRDWETGKLSTLKFGDGTIILGGYISMLATEFYLLNQANQSTLQTRKELYYALKAFNRLDLKAEECMNMTCVTGNARLNGYYMREDVPPDFLTQHPELKLPNETSPLTANELKIDYVPNAGNGSECLELSHDQTISMLMGIRLIKKYIPSGTYYRGDSDTGPALGFQDGETDILFEAQLIANRVIGYLSYNGWLGKRPCGGLVDNGHGGNNSWAYVYPLSKITNDIGPTASFNWIPLNHCVWNDAVSFAILSPGEFNWVTNSMTYQLMAMGAPVIPLFPTVCPVVLTDDRNILANQSTVYQAGACEFEWMPLLHSIIEDYDLTNNLWPNTYAYYLNKAPCNGPHAFPQELYFDAELAANYPFPSDNVGHYEWSTPSLLFKPCKRWDNDLRQNIWNSEEQRYNPEFPAEYNGIDYMLLYNLYRINQIRQDDNYYPGYYNMQNNVYTQNLPYGFNPPFGPQVIYGNHATPFKREAFETITSTSKITTDGDVTFRAGKEIALKPGFEVHATADFHGYIDPLTCNSNDNYYYRSVSGENVSGKVDVSDVKVDLFPNPASTDFTVRSTDIIEEVRVYDLNGKQVLHQSAIGMSSVEIDATLLVRGLYIVEVVSKKSSSHFRVKLSLN